MLKRILILITLLVLPVCLFAEEGTTALQQVNHLLLQYLFFDISFGIFNQQLAGGGVQEVSVPLVVTLLFFGGIFITFYYRFINLRGFWHAIKVVAGKYDKEGDAGDVSHFKALSSALSATIGLGNIAGVAIAIQMGGPGAAVWMIIAAFFGMSLKFHSCTLSQLYRQVNADGSISGGPMYYLELGFKDSGKFLKTMGKTFAVMYAVFICFSMIGAGCMFQVNQTIEAFQVAFDIPDQYQFTMGIIIAAIVGIVIFGGIKRIAEVTSKVVPFMCGLYLLTGFYVIAVNIDQLIPALQLMISMAFNPDALLGGLVGVMVIGIRRGSFSNEAGIGSAAIVHAAARTDQPVREGLVAMLGPFIDTMVVCLTTALVVVVTGTWNQPEIIAEGGNIGVAITSVAFASVLPWFPYVLAICIFLFAYSSIISWTYYAERAWIYLFNHFKGSGLRTVFIMHLIILAAIIFASNKDLADIIEFSDVLFLSLAIPNIIGGVLLAPKVKEVLKKYQEEFKL